MKSRRIYQLVLRFSKNKRTSYLVPPTPVAQALTT
jgi:hypothetical protein